MHLKHQTTSYWIQFLSLNNKKQNLVTIPLQFHTIKTYIRYYFKYYPTEHE